MTMGMENQIKSYLHCKNCLEKYVTNQQQERDKVAVGIVSVAADESSYILQIWCDNCDTHIAFFEGNLA